MAKMRSTTKMRVRIIQNREIHIQPQGPRTEISDTQYRNISSDAIFIADIIDDFYRQYRTKSH